MAKDPEYFRFVIKNTIRGLVYFSVMVALFIIIKLWMPENWKAILAPITDSPALVYLVFFGSETFFGIIPPEFFIMWAVKSPLDIYILQVTLFSLLSFMGAFIAFFVGKKIKNGGFYDRLLQSRFSKYVGYYQRYGGVIIILSGLTPLPFATISLISATLGFKFSRYCLFALTRFIRFLIYGYVFWQGEGYF